MNEQASSTEPLDRQEATLRGFLTRHGLWRDGAAGSSESDAAICRIKRLHGGANNAVFRVDVPAGPFLLKQYFAHPDDERDRFGAEVSFCRFAWEHGICVPPQLLASSREERLALFEFVVGQPVTAAGIDESMIGQALRFCQRLQDARVDLGAGALPLAAESCFSIQQHLACVERRIHRLQTLDPKSELERDVERFVRDGLARCWDETRDRVLTECRALGVEPESELPAPDRILSPSDFGFHNALLDRQGRVRFFDFEYAGWDDPAKLVCDFFCQVEVPVPRTLFPRFCTGIVSGLRESDLVRQRIGLLFPVYQLKWCCIVLNEFLPLGRARRQFSAAHLRSTRQPEIQFEKARCLLNELHERR